MASRNKPYDFVTVSAENTDGMNINDTVLFHAFNPRGVAKHQRRIDDAVTALVEAGTVKSGALIAYGSLDSYSHDALIKMIDSKPSARSLNTVISMYSNRNARALAFVAENGGRVADPVIETVEQVRARREAVLNSLV